jgi:hypothetical protein
MSNGIDFTPPAKRHAYLYWIGLAFLSAAFAFVLAGLTWFAVGSLVAVGLADVALIVLKDATISQWIQDWFPKAIDYAVLVGLLVVCIVVCGVDAATYVAFGGVAGHLFWAN